MSNFDIGFVSQLIDSTMSDDFLSVELGQGSLLLVSELIAEFPKTLVIIKVSFIVSHVAVKFDFKLVMLDLSIFSLILELVIFFLKQLNITFKCPLLLFS
jgi:hypothetical protein